MLLPPRIDMAGDRAVALAMVALIIDERAQTGLDHRFTDLIKRLLLYTRPAVRNDDDRNRAAGVGHVMPAPERNALRRKLHIASHIPPAPLSMGTAGIACFRQIIILGHAPLRSEEHTSELQSLMRISYAVFCLKKKKIKHI